MLGYTVHFSGQDTSLERVGGKGANLAQLAQSGFPVPPGFIVTTEAYRKFVQVNDLQKQILALIKGVHPEDMASLEAISEQIRAQFEREVLPTEIADEVAYNYHSFLSISALPADPNPPVAVRSSATAEDLPGLAFAGQQDTYLNVTGNQAVLEAVKKCWGSLWTARAIAYRSSHRVSQDQVALAVVIQLMIPSEVSGIAFTANPVSGRRDEMVIEASYGLGETIVSGEVDPDRYILDVSTRNITRRQLGAKQAVRFLRPTGGTELVQRPTSPSQALPDEQILELAGLALRVANLFKVPQDIEWAYASHRFYLLQSRPITSLYPLPEENRIDGKLHIYINFNAIQGVTGPITPLGMDAIRLLFGGIFQILKIHNPIQEILPAAGNRLFLDFGDLPGDPVLRNFVLNFLASTEPGAQQTLTRLLDEGRIRPKRVLTLGRAISLLVSLLPILRSALVGWLHPENVRPRVTAKGEMFLARVKEHLDTANDLLSRLNEMENDLSHAEAISLDVMPVALLASETIPLLDRWLCSWLDEKPGAVQQLLRSLPGNVTVEMNLKLWEAAQEIRADSDALNSFRNGNVQRLGEDYRRGNLPTTAQAALTRFLNIYGMRGIAEIDLGRPRWREDPAAVLQTLQGYLQVEDLSLAPDRLFQQGLEQAEHLTSEYIGRVRELPLGKLRAWLLSVLIRRIRTLGALREVPLFYLAHVFDLYRTALLSSASELVAAGELECDQDIFFVPLDTLKHFAQGEKIDLREIVAAQRAVDERERERKQMPRVLLSTGEAFYEGVRAASMGENVLKGQAVSPGIVEGEARVILDPRGAHLKPGEILVCPSTDPGWTPLFLTAGGLVMEIGGMITHGSIVAREFGLPAVVGIQNVTEKIRTGQRLRVDGNLGEVSILNLSD